MNTFSNGDIISDMQHKWIIIHFMLGVLPIRQTESCEKRRLFMKKKVFAAALSCVMAAAMAAVPVLAEDVVTIGVFEPASGDNGAGGKQEVLGMQYANAIAPTVEIGGVEYKVELNIQDNESSADKAPSAAAAAAEGASVVLGSYGSSVSIAAGDTFKNAGVAAIGVTCTNPQVTEDNDNYFRICFTDPDQGTVLANFASSVMNADKAYVLVKQGDDYSMGLAHYFMEAFTAGGGTIVGDGVATFPEGNADFTSYITTAINEGAGVIFAPTSTEAAQLIIETAAAQGVSMPLLAGDTWDSNVILSAAKDKDVQIYVTTFYQEGADEEFDAAIKEWINSDSERSCKQRRKRYRCSSYRYGLRCILCST